jgi:hypothetical protein
MTATRIVAAMAAVVLAVEVAMWTGSGVRLHVVPGTFAVFSAVGALVLVAVAKGLAAAGVQQPAPVTDPDDE